MNHSDYSLKPWLDLVKNYKNPKTTKSVGQLLNSFLPFLVLWILAYFALQVSFWLMIPFAIVAGLFSVRIFIIQHDCGHGSFFKNKKIQDAVGFVCSMVSFTPYHYWKMQHALHHAHSGDLDHRDIGEIETYTVDEYLHLSSFEKIKYRILRNPLVLFLIAPFFLFVVLQRFPKARDWNNKKAVLSVVDTNLMLIILSCLVAYFTGWKSFLIIQGIIIYVAASAGVWLFYVQHQFEDGYWYYKPEWNLVQSALHGSSYFQLPKVLQWLSGNIGFHHIHHLSPQIPNYELERCHKENPIFEKEVTTLTLKNCWQTMQLRFWDEEKKKLVTPKDIKIHYQSKHYTIQEALKRMEQKRKDFVLEVKGLQKKLKEVAVQKSISKEQEIKRYLLQSQLKTLYRLARKESKRNTDHLKNYHEELEKIKEILQKYFPKIS